MQCYRCVICGKFASTGKPRGRPRLWASDAERIRVKRQQYQQQKQSKEIKAVEGWENVLIQKGVTFDELISELEAAPLLKAAIKGASQCFLHGNGTARELAEFVAMLAGDV